MRQGPVEVTNRAPLTLHAHAVPPCRFNSQGVAANPRITTQVRMEIQHEASNRKSFVDRGESSLIRYCVDVRSVELAVEEHLRAIRVLPRNQRPAAFRPR